MESSRPFRRGELAKHSRSNSMKSTVSSLGQTIDLSPSALSDSLDNEELDYFHHQERPVEANEVPVSPLNYTDAEHVESHDDDDQIMAMAMLGKLMSTNNLGCGPAFLGIELAERASTVDSINWLGRHVPCCVLSTIHKEALAVEQDISLPIASLKSRLPTSESYQAALLFIDMSGFTKLSQALDVESLSKAINSYFQAIVDEVISHGGDILKFAGDAIFAEWRVEEGDHDHERSKPQKSSSKRTTQKSESSSALRKQSSEEEDKQTSRRRGKSPTKVRPIIINAVDASAGKGSTSGSTITPQIRVSTKSGSSTCAVKRPIPERRIVSRTSSMGAARRTDLTSRGCTTKDPIAARTATSSNERRRTIPVTTANPRPSNSRIKMSGNSSGSQSSSESSKSSASRLKMEDCVHAAAVCGAMIVNKCADYPIYEKSISGGQGPLVATLNIHCGIGAGKMAGIHVGNDSSCREYLVLGDPIDQVAEACDSAEMGEIRASRDALEYLNKGQEFKNQLRLEENTKSKTIASRKKMYFSKRRKAVWSLDGKIRKPLTPKERSFAIPFDDMSTTDLTAFHRLLSLYVHPVVLGDESSKAAVPSSRGGKNAQNRHRAEAELRSVCTIFIMPKITIKLTDDDKVNDKAFKQLDGIMNVVIDVLDSFKGHLRQYIVDDKGTVLIATFGLRGSTFPNMVAERCLPTCRIIHSALQDELGVDSQVGATLGKVYCGVVGGLDRHEYAVLGPSVNLAARLMASKNNPGVMVDDEVRKMAKGMNFISFPPVKAKGYARLVNVYKPLTAKEARWGRVNPKFVGRKKEIDVICKLAFSTTKKECPSKIVFVWGESGSGKSAFVVQAISNARKMFMMKKKSAVITRNISSEIDSLVPFSLFRSIFRDVLSERPISDDSTLGSRGTASIKGKDYDGYSIGSGSTFNTEKANVIERLHTICQELHAPEGFLEIVGQHLLGDKKSKISKVEKAPEVNDIISFMARVFIKSTSHAEGVILALDDVQWIDSLSWKVLQCIFETSKNVLIVCGSRPIESYPLSVDDEFWTKLNGECRGALFTEITIAELKKDEIREMAAITLSCEPEDVDDEFRDDVFTHSGGLPYFASEILDNCVWKGQCGPLKNGKIGWKEGTAQSRDGLQFQNIEELLLQRLDNLDDMTRKSLHFATILGMSFKFDELLEICLRLNSVPSSGREAYANSLKRSMKAATKEGIIDTIILELQDEGGSEINDCVHTFAFDLSGSVDGSMDLECVEYSFHHDTWRRVIMSLLLDSYIQDIHRQAAMAIEARVPDNDRRDYRTKVKLFSHWKGSDDTINAGKVALDVGRSFSFLGMNSNSAQVYGEAINMWKRHDPPEGEERLAGFSPLIIESLDEENLVTLIKLQTNLGQSLGSAYTSNDSQKESTKAFKNALTILRASPVSTEVKDRTFIFPIYSGMFFLLKYGVLCEPSEQVETELDLVAKFVRETEIHGDPVHYGRALAMQGETCHRLGRFEEAIESHMKLKEVYDVDKHSSLVVAAYASDRCAQNFGLTANCYNRLGQLDKALAIADHIEFSIMPKMDPKNVHNSMVTIYPILWILKDNGMAKRSLSLFQKHVKGPFDEFFGEDGSTPFLLSFKPFEVLLNTFLYIENEHDEFDKNYIDWALDLKNMEIPSLRIDMALGNFARGPMSISAEACLLLSKLTDDPKERMALLRNGAKLSTITIGSCDGSDGNSKNQHAYAQIKPVHDELDLLLQNGQSLVEND